MDTSILLPVVPGDPAEATPFAALAKFAGAARLWQGQSLKVDGHQTFASLAGAGLRLPVGIGVSLMPLRHPFEAALQARSLAAVTGEPVVAGFGPGAPGLQEALLGRPYPSPLGATREYVRIVRGLLDGDTVEQDGGDHTCRAALPRLTTVPVEVGVGVLRPRMARLAGEVADAAITWMTPAAYLRDVITPALRAGAATADRPPPRLVAIVPVALRRRDRGPVEVALASNAPHLQAPHYLDMLGRAGVGVRPGDLRHNAQAAVAGGAFVTGDVDDIGSALSDFEAAGVDELVLNVTGVTNLYGPHAAVDELRRLLAVRFTRGGPRP